MVDNPSTVQETISKLTDRESKRRQIENEMKKIVCLLNPNADQEILTKTPLRYTDAMLEMTKGYYDDVQKLLRDAVFDCEKYNEILIVKDINFSSMCEHHLLPFFGNVSVGYIPNEKILGLSKFPRLVESVSKKLHLQERLTKEIADAIEQALDPTGVVVIDESIHSCMCFRGIKAFDSKTLSIYTLGKFKEKETLDRFFQLLK